MNNTNALRLIYLESKSFLYGYLCFRVLYGYLRYHTFRFFSSINQASIVPTSINNTVKYNLRAIQRFPLTDFLMPRMPWLLNAVFSIPEVSSNSRFLVIGPRSESDIFILKSHGAVNITAIDLISYSPLVTIGDMHSMPFENDSFDVIIIGWTLPYSADPDLAIKEVSRVAAPECVIAIGFEYIDPTKSFDEMVIPEVNSMEDDISFKGINRMNEAADVRKLLRSNFIHVDTIYSYDHFASKNLPISRYSFNRIGSSQVMTVDICRKYSHD